MAPRRRVISHTDFVRDLGRGALGEDVVEVFFRHEFGVVARNVSKNNPDYDMIVDDIVPALKKKRGVVPKKLLRKIFKESFGYTGKDSVTVEVKFDEAAARYKNFFFEIFFDVETGSPGTIFKCKADLIVWVVPSKAKFKVYIFRRAELLAWLFDHVFNVEVVEYKIPAVSPYARGLPISIKLLADSAACIGEFEYKI